MLRHTLFSPYEVLHRVKRRFRLPTQPGLPTDRASAGASTALFFIIEKARQCVVAGQSPDDALQRRFLAALADLIHEALDSEQGDPAFQAMVWRHQWPEVDEYARLQDSEKQHRRSVRASVNAVAHPGRQQRTAAGWRRDAMVTIHELAMGESWIALAESVQEVLAMSDADSDSDFRQRLQALHENSSLADLRRMQQLAIDSAVQEYQRLCSRLGPRQGSAAAADEGSASRQRGAQVERKAEKVIQILAARLNDVASPDGTFIQNRASSKSGVLSQKGNASQRSACWRVVTAMHVPASLSSGVRHAKTEWDVVLLRRAERCASSPVWDVCLLVEAKASADAATTDFPRMLRGLRVLNAADGIEDYDFQAREGQVRISGASLIALRTDHAALTKTVLYCCDVARPLTLHAASRMRLLSLPSSIEYAVQLSSGQHVDGTVREPAWHELLHSPSMRPVLDQYATARQVRELMVHPDDLIDALNAS